MANKIQKALKTRQAIINGAKELFIKRGTTNVSVNDIIGLVGISKGGFYYHFKSKNDLIYHSLIKDNFSVDLYYQSIKNKFSSKDTLEKILTFMYQKINKNDPFQFATFLSEYIQNNLNNKKNGELINLSIFKIYNEIIQKGIVEGEFRNDIEPHLLVENFFNLTLGHIFAWGYSRGHYSLSANYETFISLLLAGLLKT
jgi:AcrR family transcriptional regulator